MTQVRELWNGAKSKICHHWLLGLVIILLICLIEYGKHRGKEKK